MRADAANLCLILHLLAVFPLRFSIFGAPSTTFPGCPLEFGRCRSGDCTSGTPGTLGYWEDPGGWESNRLILGVRVRAASASDCCDKCRVELNCTYWLHHATLSATPYGEGSCYLLPDDSIPSCTPSFLILPTTTKTLAGGPCNPSVEDDPHFTDAYGVTFDFSGDRLGASYCLVTDERLHVNVLLDGYADGAGETSGPSGTSTAAASQRPALRTWIKAVGLLWHAAGATHVLRLVARAGKGEVRGPNGYIANVTFDGVSLRRPLQPGEEITGTRPSARRRDSSLMPHPTRNLDNQRTLDSAAASAAVPNALTSVTEGKGRKGLSVAEGQIAGTQRESEMVALGEAASLAVRSAATGSMRPLFRLRFLGVAVRGPFEVERYELLIPGVARIALELRPAHRLLQKGGDAHAHFNLAFVRLQATPRVHGILGQTFQPGRGRRVEQFTLQHGHGDGIPEVTFDAGPTELGGANAAGLLEGSPSEYLSSGLLQPDCQRSAFLHKV